MMGATSKACYEVTTLTHVKFLSFILTQALFQDGSHVQASKDALCVGYYESLGGCRIGKKCPLLLSLSYLLVASTLLKTARNERLRGRPWKVRAYFIRLKFP